MLFRSTFRSRQGTGVDFDKICVFCDKCCVRIDKCVFIVVKIKCVNFGRICDICDKVKFIINTLILQHLADIIKIHNILSEHIQILQILTRLAGLSCSGT